MTLDELAREYKRLESTVAPYAERMEEIKEQIRAELGHTPGTWPAGNFEIVIGSNNRMDADKFAEDYPPEKYGSLYKQVPDSDNITPATKKRYMRPAGKAKVTIR